MSERPNGVGNRLAAALATAALALVALVPFLRSAGAAVPVSLIAVNGAAIALLCVACAVLSAGRDRFWAALLLVSPSAFALLPVVEPYFEGLSLLVLAGVIALASAAASFAMRWGGAPLVAAPVGSALGAGLLYFYIEYYRGPSTDPLDAGVLVVVYGVGAALVVWSGRWAALAGAPRSGVSALIAVVGFAIAFPIGQVGFESVTPAPPAALVSAAATGSAAAGDPAPPPIVLIVIDTLRADHLAAYGYDRDTMPRLEAFFREHGLARIRSVASSPWSLPSHASMFTGLHPPRHGAHYPFVDDPDPPLDFLPLGDGIPTLAELLAAAGYWTVGVSGNFGPLSPPYGLDRGFHYYRATQDSAHIMRNHTPWRLATEHRWHAAALAHVPPFSWVTFFGPDVPYRTADQITDEAIEAIDAAGDLPFFLFVNYIDPHSPYFPPEPHTRKFEGVQADMPVPIESAYYRNIVYREKGVVPDRERAHVTALYDGELDFVDTELSRLLERLEAHPRFDEMLVIVTSDHGEALGDHDHFGHAVSLYRELLEVPLFVKPGSKRPLDPPGGTVQSVDLFPLVLEYAGVAIPEGIDGLRWGSRRDEVSSWVYVFYTGVHSYDPSFNRELRSIERDGYKLIESTSEGNELFDVARDAAELQNLAADQSERVESMRARLGQRVGYADADKPKRREVSKETLDQLRSLGYVP